MGLLDLLKSEGASSEEEPNPYAIRDISGLGQFNFGQMENPQGIVIHHTGGQGTPEGVMNTFQQRGLATQFIMDRDGNIIRALPDGMRGQHIRPSQINGLSNANTLGIEIIAKDDSDVTDKQREAAARWLTETQSQYGIPAANVFGHGEINSHKQATEGNSVVSAWRGANRIASARSRRTGGRGSDLPMSQRTLMAYAGRDAQPRAALGRRLSKPRSRRHPKKPASQSAILRAMTHARKHVRPERRQQVWRGRALSGQADNGGPAGLPVSTRSTHRKLPTLAANIRFGARYLAARARDAGVTELERSPSKLRRVSQPTTAAATRTMPRTSSAYLNASLAVRAAADGAALGQLAKPPGHANAAERGRGLARGLIHRRRHAMHRRTTLDAALMMAPDTDDLDMTAAMLRLHPAPGCHGPRSEWRRRRLHHSRLPSDGRRPWRARRHAYGPCSRRSARPLCCCCRRRGRLRYRRRAPGLRHVA
jgi:hypothetical protein